jgi:phosphatidyl-myo-inositol dimannoside synthase
MLLYITRKNAPSIGGMQRFNQKLITHLGAEREFRLISWGRSQVLMPLFLVYAFFKTIFLRLTGKIDMIYLSDGLMSPMGWILKKLLSVPVAINIHGRDIAFSFPGYLTIVPAALRRMDRVICVSSQLKEVCQGYGIPEEILRVIPNGVNADDFTWTGESSPLKRVGIDPAGRTVLITVGRLVPKKGVDRFVEKILPAIVEKQPRVLYLVVGDGPLRESIERTVREKGLEENVKLMGDVPMDDGSLKAIYCGSDIFVMPNVEVPGDIEGFGIVAIEGGAAGLAVVASRLQGIQDAVTPGENGILLEWDDNQAFIDTILDLIEDPEKRAVLGEKARRYVIENYSWEKIAKIYSDVFSELRSAG